MTPEKYKSERQLRGSQLAVAAQLEIHRVTLARRETGVLPITREAWLALLTLPKIVKKSIPEIKARPSRPAIVPC